MMNWYSGAFRGYQGWCASLNGWNQPQPPLGCSDNLWRMIDPTEILLAVIIWWYHSEIEMFPNNLRKRSSFIGWKTLSVHQAVKSAILSLSFVERSNSRLVIRDLWRMSFVECSWTVSKLRYPLQNCFMSFDCFSYSWVSEAATVELIRHYCWIHELHPPWMQADHYSEPLYV